MKTIFIKFFATAMMIAGVSVIARSADQTRPVSDFKNIASSGTFFVHVKMDGTETLKISAPDDVINDIETLVDDGTLKIQYKKDHFLKNNEHTPKVDIYISVKTLSTLINNGSGSIKVENTVNTTLFKAVLSGSGNISANIKTGTVKVVINGSGNVDLNGQSDDADVVVTGSGDLNGKDLKTSTTSIILTGSGSVSIAADKKLNTRMIGSGSVSYTGNAVTNSVKIGKGKITKAS